MIACRQSYWFCAACVFAIGFSAETRADPPVWRPFREMAPTAQLHPSDRGVEPSIFATGFDEFTLTPGVVVASHTSSAPYVHPYDSYPDCNVEYYDYCEPALTYVDPGAASPTQGRLFELLPDDLIWRSYWAGAKESRTSALVFNEFGDELSLLDVSLGGRAAMFRNATRNEFGLWHGWEVQIEGAAMLRLNLDQNWDFDSADFRFGVPLILARNHLHYKLAYYHLSSHVGDEFLVRNPDFMRINFSRDVLVLGASYFPAPAARLYGETGYAFVEAEGSDQWEFQFGFDLAKPGPTGGRGTPFLAVNGHLREEVRFGGNFALQAGWLWRGDTGRVMRTGLHYYSGKSPQFEFFDTFEQQLGFGLWQEY